MGSSSPSTTPGTIKARIDLHPGQSDLWDIAERKKVTVAVLGRRWGKTFWGCTYSYDRLTRAKDPATDVAWVTPSYDLGRIAWEQFYASFEPAIEQGHKTEHWIKLKNGHRLWFRSADNPVSIRGRGYGLMIVDEGAWIAKDTYEKVMQPTLADTDGDLVVTTTPGGRRGWVYEEFTRAKQRVPDYGYLQRPSTDNPNEKVKRWLKRREPYMTATAIAQEVKAQFVEDSTALFQGLEKCAGGRLEEPRPGAHYTTGVDLAKTHSWTVNAILNIDAEPWQLVHLDRFHQLEWPQQVAKVKSRNDQYNGAPALIDSTGKGDPVFDMMREKEMAVDGYYFTTPSRKKLLDGLVIAIQERRIRIPQELLDGVCGEELRSMAVDIDAEGRTTYRSRGGFNDCVMAIALAVQSVGKKPKGKMVVGEVDSADSPFRREW